MANAIMRRRKGKFGKMASDYAIGESVYLLENGTAVEYLVVHQGLPSDLYDESCNGTWLLRKCVTTYAHAWGTNNDYENSSMNTYLNDTFLGSFDATTQSAIKRAKIPYWKGTGYTGSLATGANGLSTKIFLLSVKEIGGSGVVGANLSYFTGATNDKRIAYNSSGSAKIWTTRDPHTTDSEELNIWSVLSSGKVSHSYDCDTGWYVRPALIINSETLFDPEHNEILKAA